MDGFHPVLFANELALAGNSLMRFGRALNSIFKLTIALWQLLGYDVAAAGSVPVDDVRCECDSLVHSKLMLGR